MSEIVIQIQASIVIPTLQIYRDWFDSKYPCTDESNDGSDMPIEDEVKYQVHSYLLNAYNKCPEIYKQEYENLKTKVQNLSTLNEPSC